MGTMSSSATPGPEGAAKVRTTVPASGAVASMARSPGITLLARTLATLGS
jgi:hypothetical protein